MNFRIARLGAGDWLVLAGAAGLIADLFAGRWFSYPNGWYGVPIGTHAAPLFRGQDGWQALAVLGPIAAVVAAAGILTFMTQALRRSPAVPVVLTTLLTPAAFLVVLALVVRTLIAPPDTAVRRVGGSRALNVDAGAYVGLGFGVVLAVGLFLSLRREGIAAGDGPAEIETIKLDVAGGT